MVAFKASRLVCAAGDGLGDCADGGGRLAQGLRDGGDQLHLDMASARELGRRYAAALLSKA